MYLRLFRLARRWISGVNSHLTVLTLMLTRYIPFFFSLESYTISLTQYAVRKEVPNLSLLVLPPPPPPKQLLSFRAWVFIFLLRHLIDFNASLLVQATVQRLIIGSNVHRKRESGKIKTQHVLS